MSPINILPIVTQARAAGLSIIELHALGEIWSMNAVQPHNLAELLGISTASLTGIADRLLEKGLILRTPNLNDRRSHWISLTPKGEDTLEVISGRLAPRPA